jgi:hypothetical protein
MRSFPKPSAVAVAAAAPPGPKRAVEVAETAEGAEVAEDRDYAYLAHQTFVSLQVEGAEGAYDVSAAVVEGD